MGKEEITFVLLAYTYWVEIENRSHRRKHRHSYSIADASQSNSGTLAMDHPINPWYYHIEYASLMYTRACWVHRRCRRCFWDILNLGVPRWMFAGCCALLGDILSMALGDETSGENFNTCIEVFLDVPMPWLSMTITRVRRWSFAELLAHGGAALAITKFVQRESIGRLEKLRATATLQHVLVL